MSPPGAVRVERPDQQVTSGTGRPGQLGHDGRGFLDELEHGHRDRHVERPVPERQAFERTLQAAPAEPRGSERGHSPVEIEADHSGTSIRQRGSEATRSTAPVQHVRPAQRWRCPP